MTISDDTTIQMPALLTQQQVAQYLGFSESWLERDRWAGPKIPYTKVGRNVRYYARDIVAYLEAQTVRPIPTFDAKLENEQLTFICPSCGEKHWHGCTTEDGAPEHRVAHCGCHPRGYFLRPIKD